MKRLIFSLFALAILSFTSYAQINSDFIKAMDAYRSNKMIGGISQFLSAEDIQGSPYLNDDFIQGKVYTTSGTAYENIPLRYNIYSDDMEFKTEQNEVMSFAAPETVEKIEFGENLMVYIPFTYAKKIRKGYMFLLEEGKVSLYMRPEIAFVDATQPGAYKDATPARFDRKPDTYYLRSGSEEAKLIESKKDLLEFFPDHNAEVEEFVKKNKVKDNDAGSLKELVKYYNSL